MRQFLILLERFFAPDFLFGDRYGRGNENFVLVTR
jgi:hypothetical protein